MVNIKSTTLSINSANWFKKTKLAEFISDYRDAVKFYVDYLFNNIVRRKLSKILKNHFFKIIVDNACRICYNASMLSQQPVFKYIAYVSIPPPSAEQLIKAKQAINIAYGFKDGHCNERNSGGKLVGKPLPDSQDETQLIDAHYNLNRYCNVKVEVSIYKDGSKSCKFVD